MSCCIVCEKPFSLWARMSGDAYNGICQSCEGLSQQELRATAALVVPGCDLGAMFTRFDQVASKYRLAGDSLISARVSFFQTATLMLEKEPRIAGQNITALGNFAKGWSIGGHATEETTRAAGVINRRVAIECWDSSSPPAVQCSGLMLQGDEVCRWEEPARMYDQRSQFIGTSQGISIPIGGGMRYHVGAFRGAPMNSSYMVDCGDGSLHLTNQRICFAGSQSSASIPWHSIINISGFTEGFSLHTSSTRKPTIIQVTEPELTVQIIGLVHSASVN